MASAASWQRFNERHWDSLEKNNTSSGSWLVKVIRFKLSVQLLMNQAVGLVHRVL
jgi:hypothetical protein